MSAQIRPAQARDIEPICHLLHTKMNARIPVDRWRKLMAYPWLADPPDFGRVVESDGKILGYCGMVYSHRLIGDAVKGMRKERMVSMSSWYLDRSLRGQGLGRDMLLSAIDDPELTYSTLTNSRKPLGIVEALGFKVLEDRRYLWRKTNLVVTDVSLIDEPMAIRDRVAPYQRELIDDMSSLPLVPMLLEADERQALIFLSIKRKDADVLWFDLMYSSDLALFVDCAQAVANKLLPDTPAVLAADGRFVPQPPEQVECERLPVARYYVSQRVAPHEIDHLYGELQLLDLKLD